MSGVSLEHKSSKEAVKKGRARHHQKDRGVVRDTNGHTYYRMFVAQPCPTCGSTSATPVADPDDAPSSAPESGPDPDDTPSAGLWMTQMDYVQSAFADEHPFDEATIRVGDTAFVVAVASSPEQKAMGMMGRSYDGWDAMLFIQDEPAPVTFHNNGVPQATKVATFDADGLLVEQFTMQANDAKRVNAAPHKYALERQGDAVDFDSTEKLAVFITA